MHIKNYTFSDFSEVITQKRLIIFGASDYLKLIDNNFRELQIAENAICIVDNDKKKWGMNFALTGGILKILPPEQLYDEAGANTLVLIAATSYAWEIYCQLEQNIHLKEVSCLFLMWMISNHSDCDSGLRVEIKGDLYPLIPKKIHCFWFSGDEKDALSKKCIESWKKNCPEYEIIEWNADNYDISKHPYMKKAFDARKWAFVSDYARLDVLYEQGGFYFDLDVELFKSIDPLRIHDFIIGFGPYRDIEAAAFGAKAKCRFVKDLLEIYKDRDFDWERVLAGEIQPVYLNREFLRLGFLGNGRFQEHNGVSIYPKELFSDRDPFTEKVRVTDLAFGVHHCAGGWWTKEGRNKHEMAKEAMLRINKLYEDVR